MAATRGTEEDATTHTQLLFVTGGDLISSLLIFSRDHMGSPDTMRTVTYIVYPDIEYSLQSICRESDEVHWSTTCSLHRQISCPGGFKQHKKQLRKRYVVAAACRCCGSPAFLSSAVLSSADDDSRTCHLQRAGLQSVDDMDRDGFRHVLCQRTVK